MDLAKPGLIKQFCLPNAMFTFNEYLQDFASEPLRLQGKELIKSMFAEVGKPDLLPKIEDNLCKIDNGERDIYF